MDALFDLFSGFLGGRLAAWFDPAGGFSAKAAARRILNFEDQKRVKIPIRMRSYAEGDSGKVRRTTFEVAIDGGKPPRKITKGWWDTAEYGSLEAVVGSDGASTEDQEPGKTVLRLTPLSTGRVRELEFMDTDWMIVRQAATEALQP